MKLSSKLHLFSLSILTATTVLALTVGMVIIDELVRSQHYQVMHAELDKVRERIFDTLSRSGERAAARAADDLQLELRGEPLRLKSAQVYIVEAPDRVIFHPEYQKGDRFLRDEIGALFEKSDGITEYTSKLGSRFAIYTTIRPIDWMIFISIDKHEMYAKADEYLRNIILISLGILALSALAVSLFVRRFAGRLQITLDGIRQIDEGDLDSRIPVVINDELGQLQTGINAMSASIQARTIEQQKAEQALRVSEVRFRNLVQKLQAAVIVHGPDTQIISANSMAQDLLGLSETQLLGRAANDPTWNFLREDGSVMPKEEYPVNQVLNSHCVLQNLVVGVERPDREDPLWTLVSALPITDEVQGATQVIVSFTDITERKRAEHHLAASEQLFRTLVENSPNHIARYDLNLRRIYINPALAKEFAVPLTVALGKTTRMASPLIDPKGYMANLRKVIKTGRELSDEIAYRTPADEIRWASSRFAPEFDMDGKIQSVLVISNDITEQKQAELERQENLRFLEYLDRVNRVLQTEGDIEQTMNRALEEIRTIFDCDHAYLLYPCDPQALIYKVPIESTNPDFPGAHTQAKDIPSDESISTLMGKLLESKRPVQLSAEPVNGIPERLSEEFSMRSFLGMALHPRIDKAWLFGIHQCAQGRLWTDREVRLFEEIGHRLSDGLNSLLITHNLRDSEARFRLVFENSPVSIQEEDYSAVKTHLESLRPQFGDDLAGYLAEHAEVVEECARLVRVIDINNASLALHQADSKDSVLRGLPQIFLSDTLEDFREILISLMGGMTNIRRESVLRTLDGFQYHVDAFLSVCPGYEASLGKVLVSLIDITELKRVEQERQLNLSFLENLDRISRVLQEEGEIEQIMNRALKEVLDIFGCDRAYLLYPCDPRAPSFAVPIESTTAGFPGAHAQGMDIPTDDFLSWLMDTLLESEHPFQLGANSEYPISDFLRQAFSIQSILAMALRPRVDRAWQFGIHQCAYERVWTDQEIRLFEEIGHRFSEALNDLLATRNLRESETRFRLVFENSPVPIQEEDYSAAKAHLESLRTEYGEDLSGYLTTHPEVVHECAALVRMNDVNRASLLLHEAENRQTLFNGLPQIFLPETMDDFREVLISLMAGETHLRLETEIKTLNGRRHHIDAFVSVCAGYEQSLGRVLVSLVDISELKQAEQEHQEHLYFLESLDRVNRVLQEEGNIEQILNRAMDEVLEIFDCDRVYLLYPCDPSAPRWSVPLERNKPEYPGVFQMGAEIPVNDYVAWEMGLVLDADHPICVGPGSQYPVAEFLKQDFNIQSFMATALYPSVDRPWQFGIHQCSYERVWNDPELRLFEEISHRLSDALNKLLITRNLRESEERFRLVYENSPVPIWEEDFSAVKSRLDEIKAHCGDDIDAYLQANPETVEECAALVKVVNINSAVLELHQADSKEELYEGLPKTFLPESYDAFREELVSLANGETNLFFDGAVQTLKGKRLEVGVSFSVCPGYERSLSKVFVSLFDITQRKQDEERLRLAASVFSTSQEGILISNAENRIIDINPAFTRLTGFSREEALGQDPGFLSAGHHDRRFYADMWETLSNRGEWQGEIWNQRKSGEVYPELLSIVAVKDDQGELQHYVGAFSDISILKQHQADLDRIAHYDMLTAVPNRRLLGDRLDQAIAYARRHQRNLAVCYLDLDGFKPINDQFGHEGGDRMLIEIARRLESMSRGEDTVARLGGDEFVMLWNDIGDENDCVRALERILDKVAEPMLLDETPVTVSASIGVTLFPDDEVDADSLLRHADHAMYTAKQLGKNRYQIFDARLERQIAAQAELLSLVSQGLDKEQFELYYQPKVDYRTMAVMGVEALLRWNDPVLGLLAPSEFLSLIENDTLAFRMGHWVVNQAVRQARSWNDMGLTLPISVNIFPHHLKYSTFIDDLNSTIAAHWPQMPKHRLLMEIVESSALEELEPIEQVIKECVKMGIGFSLDDFGTGYSSLVYLRSLSIEELKIDKSFVRDMLDDPDDEAIVNGVIGLGQAFGLRVVAEGVETTQQAEHLVKLGCSTVQGYRLGRPMTARDFEEWYKNFSADKSEICDE